MAELGQQIAKLMAALTKAGKGNSPSSVPSGPSEWGHGRDAMVAAPPATQIPIMLGVVLDRPPQPAAYPLGRGHQKWK